MLETWALVPPQISGAQSKNVGKGVMEHDLNPNWNNDFIGDIGEEKTSLLEYSVLLKERYKTIDSTPQDRKKEKPFDPFGPLPFPCFLLLYHPCFQLTNSQTL